MFKNIAPIPVNHYLQLYISNYRNVQLQSLTNEQKQQLKSTTTQRMLNSIMSLSMTTSRIPQMSFNKVFELLITTGNVDPLVDLLMNSKFRRK